MAKRAVSRVSMIVAGAAIIVVVLGSAFEFGLIGNGPGSASFDVQPLLHSRFGLYLTSPTRPTPTGIASWGLYNESGSIRTYSISTTEVIGQANISTLEAVPNWNYSLYPQWAFYSCGPCAALLMNVVVLVNTSDGVQRFWVQNNVHFFSTSTVAGRPRQVGYVGELWNFTTPTSNLSRYASGTGMIGDYYNQSLYMFGSLLRPSGSYALPLSITLKTSVSFPNDTGVEVTLSDGPSVKEDYGVNFTGTVFLPIKHVESAAIAVNPYLPSAPGIPANDAELVWGGFCCFQAAKFDQMDSSLSLSYLNAQGGVVPFPSFYTFGETGEFATNLSVTQTPGGGRVTIGTTNNTYLGG